LLSASKSLGFKARTHSVQMGIVILGGQFNWFCIYNWQLVKPCRLSVYKPNIELPDYRGLVTGMAIITQIVL
jgi:hypothetical protein